LYNDALIFTERNKKHYGLEEAEVLFESGYEFKFQPKVHLGIKTQFYYTVSTSTAESITLVPYIHLLF